MWTAHVFVTGGELGGNWKQDFATEGEALRFRDHLFATNPTVYAVEVRKAGGKEE